MRANFIGRPVPPLPTAGACSAPRNPANGKHVNEVGHGLLPQQPFSSQIPIYKQPSTQALAPNGSDYNFAPRLLPTLPVSPNTPLQSPFSIQLPLEQYRPQAQVHNDVPLSCYPSLTLPSDSPSHPTDISHTPANPFPTSASISSPVQSEPQRQYQRQDQTNPPLGDDTPSLDLYCSTQPIPSTPFTAHNLVGFNDNNDAVDNNGTRGMHMGVDAAALSLVGDESSFVGDSSLDGPIAHGLHYQQDHGHTTHPPLAQNNDPMSLSLAQAVAPIDLALDKVTQSPGLDISPSAVTKVDAVDTVPVVHQQRDQYPSQEDIAHLPLHRSPLHDMLVPQQSHQAPQVDQTYGSPSSDMSSARVQSSTSPANMPNDTSPQVRGQQQATPADNEPAQRVEQQAEEGGKIWDLFPAITPQLQAAHSIGGGSSPQQAEMQNQQQQQMQMQHAMYQQQQAQQHYAEMQAQHQQHAHATWAQAHYAPQHGTYDGTQHAGYTGAFSTNAHAANPPLGPHAHTGPQILPGPQLGATIQHLLPPPSFHHGAGIAQGDLMSLFVPSLMLPGYPRQVPVSESFLALSPVISESSTMGYAGGQAKKGGVSNKGASGSAHGTPRMAPVQIATVPPPAPPMASVAVPKGTMVQDKGEAQQQQHEQSDVHATDDGSRRTQSLDLGGSLGCQDAAPSESANLPRTNGWQGMDIGIGVGLGLGLGLAEQTSWQTLPENALDIAQPSSFRAVFDMSAFPSFGDVNGVPMTPFTGAEWLDWPDTPLKTALKSASAGSKAGDTAAVGVSGTGAAEPAVSASSGLLSGKSEGANQEMPQSARFVSIPLYTVPGSAIDGSNNTEPTLALPPGVHVPTDAPMTGWIFDTADVGAEAVGKGLKRKRGERGRGTFSSYRPTTSPSTPGSAGPITSSRGLSEALEGTVGRLMSDLASVINRCGGSALPIETIDSLRAALDKASSEDCGSRVESLREILDQVGKVVEMLPPRRKVDPSSQTPSAPGSSKALSIETQGFSPATATTSQSAPSARVPWDEMTLPFTSASQAFGVPISGGPLGLADMPSSFSSAYPGDNITKDRPALISTKSMPPPSSALMSARSPPATGDSMWSMSSTSSGSSTGKRFTGAWTAEEVERITRAAQECKMCLSSGGVVVDWKAAIQAFGETRSKHQILVKAVELGLKDTTTSSNRRKKQRKHRQSEGSSGDGKTSPPAGSTLSVTDRACS